MVLFLVLLFGELTDSINPSLITIEYPECETETLEIFWSKLEKFLSFEESYKIYYNINIDIPKFSVLPSEYNFNFDSSKLSYKVIGNGTTVVKQLPEAGSSVYNGGMVILYTEESESQTTTVPNLIGLTANEVNVAAAEAGINVEFSGNVSSSTVLSYAQDISAQETVSLGQIVTVYFRDDASADMAESDESE
jgi:hypothetical protein